MRLVKVYNVISKLFVMQTILKILNCSVWPSPKHLLLHFGPCIYFLWVQLITANPEHFFETPHETRQSQASFIQRTFFLNTSIKSY